jgi:hypothetical protein
MDCFVHRNFSQSQGQGESRLSEDRRSYRWITPAVLQYQTAGHDAADKYNIVHDIENDGHSLVSNRPGVRPVAALDGFARMDGNRASRDGKLKDCVVYAVTIIILRAG